MRSCTLILSIALSAASAPGNWNDTPRGFDLDRLPHFPLTPVWSGFLNEGEEVRSNEIFASRDGDAVILRGAGSSRARWQVHFHPVAFRQLFRADLDGDGRQDYIVLGANPWANGRLAPLGHIAILRMDPAGLPSPFEAWLYDLDEREGPKHLLDLGGNRRAGLLISSYDEIPWDDRVGPMCSGHWTSQLLEPTDRGWREFRGTLGAMRFPLVHRWTYYDVECSPVAQPQRFRRPAAAPKWAIGSNVRAVSLLRISPGAEMVTVSGSRRCAEVRIGAIVYDHPGLREVALVTSPARTRLLEAIRCAGAQVDLYGFSRHATGSPCSAKILWAR